ncbi:glycosyltransferase family 4 protein [Phenylobacterium sp.]|uniref:glycosyltransferase family 4 protein n=1 Tax=Phenylobacterium sp. TaxID=1871053 RepID=UPI0025E76D45|nr:glycosyltransferase family 4 protein [Phenylobacterium sp.]
MHVQLYWGKDAELYRERFRQGIEPDETPYGFHLAAEEGHTVTFSRDGKHRFMSKVIERIFGFDLVHAWHNRRAIAAADVVWTMTEGEAFAVATLMKFGLVPRRPIVSASIWLFNRWDLLPWWRHWLYRFLVDEIAVMGVHSAKCLPIAERAFPNLRCELMHFGINTDYFTIRPPKAPDSTVSHIVAAGNDRTRDWDTLIQAFGSDKRFKLTLACAWLSNSRTARHKNVTLVKPQTMDELRELYDSADIIAVPMKENVFSGITVALEAAALGKPVLSSRTGGVPTYFDEDEVLYAPPGDPRALREAVLNSSPAALEAVAHRAQERLLSDDYSTRGLMARYSRITREVFSRQGKAKH